MKPALPLKGGLNFRDMGGLVNRNGRQVRPKKIIRSAMWANLTPADQQYLADYGVKYDVDLRTEEEVATKPDRDVAGVKFVFDPVFARDETQSDEFQRTRNVDFKTAKNSGLDHMLIVYRDLVQSPAAQAAYQKFFDLLLANDQPDESLVFHCAAGKDRTGMAAVFFLAALDFERDVIKQDYLASNHYLADFQRQQEQRAQAYGQIFVENTKALNSVAAAYFDRAWQTAEAMEGSMDAYLTKYLNMPQARRQQLAELYLTAKEEA